MWFRTCLVLAICLPACAGCTKKEKSTPQLLSDLKGADEKDRIIAVRQLPTRKNDAAQVIPALIGALKDSESDVRWSAAIALGAMGNKANEAIPALQEAQSDSDARVREAAGKAISRIDPNAAVHLAANPVPAE